MSGSNCLVSIEKTRHLETDFVRDQPCATRVRQAAHKLAPMAGLIPSKVNVLLIGGGGREHALAVAMRKSPRLGELHITHPGNPGLADLGRAVDVPVTHKEFYRLVQYCDKHAIGLVVIGPEDPLAEGYADALAKDGRLVFGPVAAAAKLESDKSFAKDIMRAASIPTAEGRSFSDYQAAKEYLSSRMSMAGRGAQPTPPVIKAAGLAKGKGVIVPANADEAQRALERIMVKKEFGDAGKMVVIEERLEGTEVSVLAIVDGQNILILPPAQDHKRLQDGDKGPNTGGMGVFCPARNIDGKLLAKVEREVLVPAIDALRRDDIAFRGVLYAGIMLTPAGPKVLEFNCRFGDPECQAILPRLESDALELLYAAAAGKLDKIDIRWNNDATCCVVLASEGYPEKPVNGQTITGLADAGKVPGVTIYHAGTMREPNGIVKTNGGRVLNIVARGPIAEVARERAYEAVSRIKFAGMQYRTDIG